MKIVVAGAPDFTNQQMLYSALDSLHASTPITLIIEGGHRVESRRLGKTIGSADYWARCWAEDRGVPVVTREADWDTFGTGAGPKRNRDVMAQDCPDGVVAMPGVKGRDNFRDLAVKAGIPVWSIHQGRDTLTRDGESNADCGDARY